ncbi:probable E3 ubiquitin-protein ligase HERC4 isoform X2 [Ruditapes philippinarum]|uniref:probable E3 ubiquitin-protein ligase HERC4 isoform X2 n=1 Tax=Ruditapes philippinarum TaxID=129788 RepID=UPI00295C386B|nr:probable E3 ubiquitin-protein ligase HERC4 isoform X2 [Ruditapes philippinarum]
MSRLFCWGSNQSGQLGIGNLEQQKVTEPMIVKDPPKGDIAQIVCGESHTLFVIKDGSLYSCGNNDYGQLGHSKRTSIPEQIDELKAQTVKYASVGTSHSVCLTEAGELFSWGDNSHGQLGRGQLEPELCRKPKLIKFPRTIVQVSCGRYHNLLLTDDGQIYSWGDNRFGQLGLGHTISQNIPQYIASLKGIPVAQVVCGGSHSLLLSKSGAIFGWGRNCFGQLGLNDELDRHFPCLCKSLRHQRVCYIGCGEDHTLALTLDGGVFTFGAGTFGQLGHGSKTQEILPKKVTELMGSKVTQIACGRRHCLVFVSDSGRLYGFGSEANGQLCTNSVEVKSLPVAIKGQFVAFNNAGRSNNSGNSSSFVINIVAAGGDYCFLWAVSEQIKISPLDHRLWSSMFSIKILSVDMTERISKLTSSDSVPVEFEEEVIRVFSSASCLNSSFLLKDNEHYGSSSKRHGVDLELVRSKFDKMSDTSNVHIIQKILLSLSGTLYPSLPKSPPDVEALRLYLILPHLHMFEQPKYYNTLIEPFGNSIISLDKQASRVLDLWWGSFTSPFFLRLVYIFKETVIYILQLPDPQQLQEMETRFKALFISLEVLKKLNNVNEQNGQIIPYNKFYINDLKDKVNLKGDYVNWVQTQSHVKFAPGQRLLFCNYPFTFDAAAKSLLLQTDALLQMQSAIEEVRRRNIQCLFLPIDPENPCLVFCVSRTNIVHDTLQQLMNKGSADLKKPLKVVFDGEEAQDEGGVRKEFFLLLLRELLDPKYGMFKFYEESRMQWFSPFAFEDHQMYCLIGVLCGLAIYNSVIIQLSFPLVLFKKLLNRKPSLDDVLELMPTIGRSFESLLNYEGDDIEDVFCLTFEITQECFGETKTVELVSNGSSKVVNKENRKEFVDLYVNYIFNKAVESHFSSFYTGFHKVCGGRVLELFHPEELRSMVIGNENYDFHELEKNTEYKGDYHRYHQTIKHFWDVFHDLTLEDKKKFLLYLTGSDKIPIVGMKHVKLVIQPMNVEEKYLPVAHTCFNLLDLPKYSTKETMKNKLLQAIQQTEGFGLV